MKSTFKPYKPHKTSIKNENRPTTKLSYDVALIGLFILILFIIYVRVRLLGFPLERDEGEYAYLAQLILKGFPPFTLAYNMKFPGIYYMYALIMSIFGQTTKGIHFGLMLVNITTIIFIYIITKNILTRFIALIASIVFAVLSTSSSLLGNAAHATNFVLLFGILGIYLLYRSFKYEKWYLYFITGILMSLSLLTKQSGITFPLFAGLLILLSFFKGKKNKAFLNFTYFTGGFIIPIIVIFAIFYFYGIFDKFWFWTITYASEYGTYEKFSSLFTNLNDSLSIVTKDFGIFWVLFVIGLPFIFINKKLKNIRWEFALFTFFSILSVFPGLYFRSHYFITLLPAFSIIIGILFDYFAQLFPKIRQFKYISFGIFLLLILSSIQSQKDYFFEKSPEILNKSIYYGNPFVESIKISDFILTRTNAEDKILILGSEPQIYFYTKRLSSAPYIYMYDLMYETNFALSMQKDLAEKTEKAKPKIIVYFSTSVTWFFTEKSNKFIFNWLNGFLEKENYNLVGVIDNVGFNNVEYFWFDDALKYQIPKSSISSAMIYEKIK